MVWQAVWQAPAKTGSTRKVWTRPRGLSRSLAHDDGWLTASHRIDRVDVYTWLGPVIAASYTDRVQSLPCARGGSRPGPLPAHNCPSGTSRTKVLAQVSRWLLVVDANDQRDAWMQNVLVKQALPLSLRVGVAHRRSQESQTARVVNRSVVQAAL